jgi:hypothetical protein
MGGMKPKAAFAHERPSIFAACSQALPEKRSEQLEPSGICVPGTRTCFVPSFNDG